MNGLVQWLKHRTITVFSLVLTVPEFVVMGIELRVVRRTTFRSE
jgi:hypothetical protein